MITEIDELLVHADVRRYGPGGVNLTFITKAYDAIEEGVETGVRPQVTMSIAQDMEAHGWKVGLPPEYQLTPKA